jgi:hypothetical protein
MDGVRTFQRAKIRRNAIFVNGVIGRKTYVEQEIKNAI